MLKPFTTDKALIEEVASALLGFDYVLIDLQTGEAKPPADGHIDDIINLQQKLGNYDELRKKLQFIQ